MQVTLQFSGGLELLIGQEEVKQVFEEKTELSFPELIAWMEKDLIHSEAQPFIKNHEFIPGIIVLVNDGDWELYDAMEYAIQDRDVITFITTLHGG